MRSVVLLLSTGIAWSALSYGAADDPFAPYHDALERRLTAISEAAVDVPQREPEPKPLQPERELSQQEGANSATISRFARRYWNGREADVRAVLVRLARYRPALESILVQEGVPKSLVAVVLVESGAQPLALSPKQARGLWQFIPATARQYGLSVTAGQDERIDVERSTRAAARYLRDLYTKFGDWELALAAYNAGPDTVERALKRGRASSYGQISVARLLPEETRNYVPAVLSAMELLGTTPMVDAKRERRVDTSKVIYAPAAISD